MKQKLIEEPEWSSLKFLGSNCLLDRSKFSDWSFSWSIQSNCKV